jgi:pimeloyl-ACP methyl ester carboxylesterase
MTNLHTAPISRTYQSQGLKLNYVDWGNAGAPLLLLVHGMRDHARSWDWTARALRQRWHIVAPDLRGHGDSEWSRDGAYMHAFHILDMADLIDTLGHEQVTIVGHSFGGNVVGRYASIFPQRVKKLVLVDSLGPSDKVLADWTAQGPIKRTREWLEKRRATAARTPRRLATLEEAVGRMAAANRHLSREQAEHLATHGVRLHSDGYSWKYDPVIGSFLPEDFAVNSKGFWREVTAPTLLCWGTESWTSHPEVDGDGACFREHRTVVFEKAGHWLHHDQLEAFLDALSEFL